MDESLRRLLIAALSVPGDRKPRRAIADWLGRHADPRETAVRRHCETGFIYFRNYTLSGDGTGEPPSVTFLALQLIPQATAVDFGRRCAEHVLLIARRQWPTDDRLTRLLESIRGWLRGEVTKVAVRRAAEATADLTDFDGLPAEVHGRPADEQQSLYRAMLAARSAMFVTLAVRPPAMSDQWTSDVCAAATEAISAADRRKAERTWQRRELLRLLA
jgi:hypothetical protein